MNELITLPPADPLPANDPLTFIARAVERGTNPDELGKLLDLHERVTRMQAERAYSEAMNRCQDQMPTIVKNTPGQHKKYAAYEDVLTAIKPIYVSEGFALSFATDQSLLANHYRIVCDVKHTGGHSERYYGDFPADGTGPQGGKSAMNPIQGVGSMYTYARRYLTFMIFNLTVAGEDTDAARQHVTSEAELAEQDKMLGAIREVYEQVYADVLPESDEEEKFWRWLQVGPGDFNDIPTAKYRDVLTNLRRKLAQKKKAVPA